MTENRSSLPDNSVEYHIYSLKAVGDRNFSKKSYFEEIRFSILAKIHPFLKEYVWQEDAFNLAVHELDARSLCLRGLTRFGDNIDDEWFLVFLLFLISKEFSECAIRVNDSDSEFLLIEAAETLPPWIKPENSNNRVFIYQGALHIIPIAQNPGHITWLPSGEPDLVDALLALQRFPSITRVKPSVEAPIRKRIDKYPGYIWSNFHHAHCYLPASVAAILQQEPKLVAPAVQAFYCRDPIDLKACRVMKHFPPSSRLLKRRVRFTRCLYAQLVQQQFRPDKRSGWTLPPPMDPQFKANSLGCKLTSGFEILVSRVRTKTAENQQDGAEELDVEGDPRWRMFLTSLQKNDYFKGELDGSKLYRELFREAKSYFARIRRDETNAKLDWNRGSEVLDLLKSVSWDEEKLKDDETRLETEDDDSWLQVSEEEVDRLLAGYQGSNGAAIVPSLDKFLQTVSGLDGVEFPSEDKEETDPVQFDPDKFMESVTRMLRQLGGEDGDRGDGDELDEDDSEMSSCSSESSMDDDERAELDKEAAEFADYMKAMDEELASTTLAKSFVREGELSDEEDDAGRPSGDGGPPGDGGQPVDVDLNAVKNILESYRSQQGIAGPASNILKSMEQRATSQ